MKILLNLMGMTLVALGMPSCRQAAQKSDGLDREIQTRAASGSKNDIESALRYYEDCRTGMSSEYCSSKLNEWADIGASYGQIGAMTIVINRDVDSNDCKILRRLLIYVNKVRDFQGSHQARYVYSWNREKDKITNKLRGCV